MDEKTKAELNQIMDMISIYQSSIDGADVETVKLIEIDLNKKKQQLSEIQERLNEELSSLYDNGGNEIDPAINQLQNEIQKINNSLETISDLLVENINLQEVNTLSEDKEIKIEKEIEGLDDFVPEEEVSTALNDSETMEIPEGMQEQDFNFTDEQVVVEKNMQEDIKLSNEEEVKPIVENLVEEELKPVENESNFLEEELNSVKIEQSSIEEELKPIEEEQNLVEEEVNFVENEQITTSDSVMVQLGEPSEEYRETAKTVVNNRKSDMTSMLKFLAAKGVLLEECKEALLEVKGEKQEENTLEEPKEPEEQDYDKGERIR